LFLAESDTRALTGHLPNGDVFAGNVRVTRPHALVTLKLLALFDRHNNIRGPEEAHHDREEARTQAADIVAIVSEQRDLAEFRKKFEEQFKTDPDLGGCVWGIFRDFFRETSSPGFLVYEEFFAAELPAGGETQRENSGGSQSGTSHAVYHSRRCSVIRCHNPTPCRGGKMRTTIDPRDNHKRKETSIR